MTNPMLAELDAVVRLSERATPGEWFISRSAPYYQYQLSAKCGNESTRLFATMDAMPFDAPANQRTANAEFVPSLVNWFRTHAPTLADMAKRLEAAERKAARYDYLSRRIYVEDLDGGWSSSYVFLPIPRHDGSTYKGAMPYHFVTLDDAIDHAIDATQEGEG